MKTKMQYQYNWIRSFHYTATLGNVSQAARTLGLAASTLSHQIKDLETLYKVKLFYRVKNRVRLTNIGLSFKEKTDRYFAQEEELRKFLVKVKNRIDGVINIGAEFPGNILSILNQKKLLEEKVKFNYFFEKNSTLMEMFLKNKVDLLIMEKKLFETFMNKRKDEDLKISSTPIYKDELVFVLNQKHELIGKKNLSKVKLSMEDLLNSKFLLKSKSSLSRNRFDALCKKAEGKPATKVFISNNEGVIAGVKQNLGIGVCLKSEIDEFSNLVMVQPEHIAFKSSDFEITFYAFYKKSANTGTIKRLVASI